MLEGEPNFKGNLRGDCSYEDHSPRRRQQQRSPSPGLGDRRKKRRERQNQPSIEDELRQRIDCLEKSYSQMDAVLDSLREKSVVPKLRSEEVDTLTEMIISVEDHSKRMEESLNRTVTELKNFEMELAAKLTSVQPHKMAADGMRGSLCQPSEKWHQDARLQLQSLEERLAGLEAAVK